MTKQCDLAAAKFRAMSAIARDSGLSKLAHRVAGLLMCDFMREPEGKAYALVSSYCEILGIASDAKVRTALGELVRGGYFAAERRPRNTSVYTVAPRFWAGSEEEESVSKPSQIGKGSADQSFPKREGYPSQNGKAKGSQFGKATLPETGIQNTYKITTDKKISDNSISGARSRADETEAPTLFPVPVSPRQKPAKKAAKSATPSDEHFEAFWLQYPRHVGKERARKAWTDAIKGGADPLVLTNAAMRFAAERLRSEPDAARREQFTPHAATWIKGRRWEDEPAPARQANTFDRPAAPSNRRPSAMEIAFPGRFAK